MSSQVSARLEVPIFGPDVGALAVSLGATRLELSREGSYGKSFTFYSCLISIIMRILRPNLSF